MSKFSELINREEPVLIDFHATWCGPCKAMSPILEQVKSKLGNRVSIIKIDVDKHPRLASELRISGVPTLLLYHHGQLKWRQSGVVPADQIMSAIQKA